MIDTILFFIHHTLTLLFGVILSVAFCGIRFSKRNIFVVSLFFIICGISQLSTLLFLGESAVWQLYPLVIHLPLCIMMYLIYKKKPLTIIASVSLAYLCCQPSKWFGLLAEAFSLSNTAVWSIKIIVAMCVIIIVLHCFSFYIAQIFNKDTRSVLIFSSVPLMYYVFDYLVSVYTNVWAKHTRTAAEFLSFSICIFFMLFCVVYYKEYEKKIEAQHKEQIIGITVLQQSKEVETIKKSNLETSLLRHDMRLTLSNLALCIEQNDKQQALKIISGFAEQVEAASLHRFCKNDTINYILTNFENKCKEKEIPFSAMVEINELPVDEILFSSIISNALDNALNAQAEVPAADCRIKFMLKASDGKLLLSVKNPFKNAPVFIDGIPITTREGHGYGTQSILYMTEKLGGKCQFSIENNLFILRIIL